MTEIRNTSHNVQASNHLQHLMNSRLGEVVARSWLEKPILSALEHWFFPLSRLWAAARRANGDVDRFFASVPMEPDESLRGELQQLLDTFMEKRLQVLATEQEWREAFFGDEDDTEEALLALERQRLAHRSEYNSTRKGFRKLRKQVQSSVYSNFAGIDEMEAVYGVEDGDFESLFMPPDIMPEVEQSKSIPAGDYRDYWIRFESPSARAGDTVYARVHEPVGVENPPTLIFGHGVGVEFDHWESLVDIVTYFPQLGIRVIRPEAPWHGRRVPDGYYGGEYFLSRAPIGAFDFFTAQHKEWAVLMDWARATSSGPLAMGGSSLGALSAQMTAIRARHWDKRFQPDALFLMTHCAHLWEVALDGALADIWGLHVPLKALGWDRRLMEEWMLHLDPAGVPVVKPEHIVSVLGKTDAVTPFHSGQRLQKLWNLPEANIFNWPSGHFSVPLRMSRHQQPMLRLQAIFRELQAG